METARHYSKGGAIRHMADGGLVGKIKGLFSSGPKETISERYARQDAELAAKIAARQPKAEPAAAPKAIDGISDYSGMTATQRREKAAGLAKGGPVQGPGTGTSDDIPIMASNGEYMVKAAAVRKLGVAFMNKLNSIADDPADQKTIKTLKKKGAVRKMASPIEKKTGVPHMESAGSVDEALRRVAPYVNHRAPSGPPVMQEQLRLPNNAPAPGSAVQTTGYKPNFTMGANTATAAAPDPVTDVRAKYNPANASPEAKAYQADRAANPGPKPAGATQAPQPAATAQAQAPRTVPKPPSGRGYGAGKVVGGAVRRMGPAAAGAGVVQSFNDYKINDPEVDSSAAGTIDAVKRGDFAGAGRSLSKGALETAMDLGSAGAKAADFFVSGDAPVSTAYDKFLRNQFGDQLAPAPGVGAQPPAPTAQPSPAPQTAAPAAPPAPAPGQGSAGAIRPPVNNTVNVKRQANGVLSFSGDDVSGPVQYAGADKAGFKPSGAGVTVMPAANFQSTSPSMDQRLSEARYAAMARGDVDGVKASYAAQGQDFGPKVDPISALVNNGKPMTVRKAAAIAQLQQQALAQQNSQADRKLAQDKFNLEKDGAKLDNAGKQRLDALQTMILDPNAKPEMRKSAIETYRALTGKTANQNRYTVVPGGQAIDPATNAVYTKPSTVIDNQTGQFVEQQGQQGAKASAPPEGTRLQKDGKYFVVKNGVPVPL